MNLGKRVGSGVALAAVLATALWVGGAVLWTLTGVLAALAVWEFTLLAAGAGAPPPRWLVYPLAGWLLFRFQLPAGLPALEIGLGVAVVVGLAGCLATGVPMLRWATAVGGALYIGLCLGYYLDLVTWRGSAPAFGTRLVAVILVAAMTGDTAAYAAGRALGRHRLFPAVSPSKTVEGAAGGVLGALVAAAIAGRLLLAISLGPALLLGALVAVAGQTGDLVESALKRQAGVKDSSALIPGHGGVLDRLDSLLLVGPVVDCYLRLLPVR